MTPDAQKAGAAAKPLLIAFGCLVFAAAGAVAGLLYLGHRVKRAVVETAKSYGVELPGSSTARASGAPVRLPAACDLLPGEEASRLIGEPVERVERQPDSCVYYGPAGLTERLAREQASAAMNAARRPGSRVDAGGMATAFDQLANSLPAARALAGEGGEMPLAILVVSNDGRPQMTALATLGAGLARFQRGAGDQSSQWGGDVPGLGDRAIRLPKLGLNVLRGEVLVRVVPGPIPDADVKTVDVARAVLKRIP